MEPVKSFKQPWDLWQHNKLTVYGEAYKDNPKARPSLRYKVYENNPRFSLYLNDGKNNKPIAFSLDPYIANELFVLIKRVIANKETSRISMDIIGKRDWLGNQYEKPTAVAKLHVGRDSEGVVYIAFQAKEIKLVKFPMMGSYWRTYSDEANEKLNKVILSEITAEAWANTLRDLTASFIVMHAKEKVINKPGNNKGGSWNKTESSSTESSSSFAEAEDVDF